MKTKRKGITKKEKRGRKGKRNNKERKERTQKKKISEGMTDRTGRRVKDILMRAITCVCPQDTLRSIAAAPATTATVAWHCIALHSQNGDGDGDGDIGNSVGLAAIVCSCLHLLVLASSSSSILLPILPFRNPHQHQHQHRSPRRSGTPLPILCSSRALSPFRWNFVPSSSSSWQYTRMLSELVFRQFGCVGTRYAALATNGSQ